MGIFDFLKKKKNPEILNPAPAVSKPVPAPPPVVSPAPASQPDPVVKEIVVSSVKDGHKIKYHYDHVDVFIPKDFSINWDGIDPGDTVAFERDPSNPHDSNAILVQHNLCKLGYMYRNKLYDMMHDYLAAGLPVYGHIDSMDDEVRKITIFLAFYGSTFNEPRKTFRLTASKGKASQEIIEYLSEDDALDVEYDFEKEKYVVYDSGEVIGALPKTAEKFVDDKSCFVDHTELDENGKFDIFVYFE